MYKVNLKNITFMIPVMIDSNDRIKNLATTVRFLLRHFDTNIIISEQNYEVVPKILHFAEGQYTYLPMKLNKDWARGKLFNKMCLESDTPYLCAWDVDILLPIHKIQDSLISLEEYDLVYPYDNNFFDMDRSLCDEIYETLSLVDIFNQQNNLIKKGLLKRIGPQDSPSVGGAFMIKKDVYIEGGMENEYILNWAGDDRERYARFKTLGYKITRLPGDIYHMHHTGSATSSNPKHAYNDSNIKIIEDTEKMTKEEILDNIIGWGWCSESTIKKHRLLRELKKDFTDLPELNLDIVPESLKQWNIWINNLRDCVLNCDPTSFLQWGIIKEVMVADNCGYLDPEFEYLQSLEDWEDKWKVIIMARDFGNPIRYNKNPKYAPHLIHYAYALSQFERFADISINNISSVFEFGGGFGGMRELFDNSCYKGKYVIYDFKEFNALQYYYLNSLYIDTSKKYIDNASTTCLCELEDLQKLLDSFNNKKMFIATWSISEAPLKLRQNILPLIEDFDYYLIGFDKTWKENNNLQYFSDWIDNKKGYEWDMWQVSHLPPGNYYLFGKKIIK